MYSIISVLSVFIYLKNISKKKKKRFIKAKYTVQEQHEKDMHRQRLEKSGVDFLDPTSERLTWMHFYLLLWTIETRAKYLCLGKLI